MFAPKIENIMKKILLSAVVVAAMCLGAQAQKNTVLVYGNVDYTSTKIGDAKSNSFTFNPAVGYQFTDHVTAGIALGLGTSKQSNDAKTNTYSAGPFIRYAQSLSNIFAVFGQFGANYENGKTKFDGATTGKYNGFGAEFHPAIGVNLKNSFALNFAFGGISYNSKNYKGISDKSNTFDVNFGQGATFGISKNF